MKRLFYIIILIIAFACDSEQANSCFKTAGGIIQQEAVVANFDKILVNRNVELILKEGAEQQVIIETGKNLMPDVEAKVLEGKLILTDNNICNYVRDYGITRVFVTSPNIVEIRSSTQQDIKSEGVLTYPNLTILSEDYGVPNTFTSANFYLDIDNDNLRVVFNNLSNAFISGRTTNLNLTFAAGTSRFEGRNLEAETVNFWNRSSNDMIVNPQQKLSGRISGTGDVIAVNKPPIVEVEEQYKGQLFFE
ncbi:head GIN domain-containing protein [Tamlana sp. 2201CG12-4]|uniref:head GIN domain-containing protein n=1 Tax=Tamlana sp. 2201CG12-4 TaxID=3112582 RepID=UPI002DB59200|nr:head GIN domain-containing protein [Tamlana sp. 2201CG12-4]MEC3905613.1 head GIN domain-containing protein [Tamlana sp. 2201CG12-4]